MTQKPPTPLWKKLGIKESFHVSTFCAPDDFAETVGPLPEGASLTTDRWTEQTDVAIMFCADQHAMVDSFVFHQSIPQNGAVWIAWPKKSSGKQTDLGDAQVRAYGLDLGLVDNKVCSVDSTWSALRFVIRVEDRV